MSLSAAVTPFDSLARRLALYGYLTPLLGGRRVLELGCGTGEGAARLRALGAASVLGLDGDAGAVVDARRENGGPGLEFRVLDRRALEGAGKFDVVVVPDAAAFLRVGAVFGPTALAPLIAPGGQIALLVASADHAGAASGGLGYYDIAEAAARFIPDAQGAASTNVRMFGLTPFAAFGLAEFSEAPSGLRIDAGLVEESGEQPTHYLALVSAPADDEVVDLGYALMQIPAEAGDAPAAPALVADADLRQRLAEAEGKAEGLVRVSRAQTEEIEELRARLRRGAEARAELDQEMARLRRALAEADASVLDLTRRTTQEMAALASRITSGLRPEAATPANDSSLRAELRRQGEELAARESALSERDDRIAALEVDRQELTWQLARAEAAAAQAAAQARPAEPRGKAAPRAAQPAADDSAQRQRELALEQYRQAAAAHLEEVGRLREALAEQSTLVAELEDALSVSGRRLQAALEETERQRKHAAEVEDADRARRSRLAEVEGTLLRLQRQTALASTSPPPAASPAPNGTSSVDFDRKLKLVSDEAAAWAQKAAVFEQQLKKEAGHRQDIERRLREAAERVAGLERTVADRQAALAAVVAPARDPEGEGAAVPRLEASLREIARLRELLERSEEQLWETKGQLLLDRERMAVLEHQLAQAPSEPTVTEAAHQSIMNAVYKELAELENGVRNEMDRLASIETTVEAWRSDLARGEAILGPSGPRAPSRE